MLKRSVYITFATAMMLMGFAILAVGNYESTVSARGFQDKPAQTAQVKIDNFSFAPPTLTIAVGTTVTWTNQDDIPHNVVSTDKSFKSRVMDTDEKFSFTFSKAGSYDYFCSIHPKMTGKVVVQ
ncbi:MAG TPA: cupredoxin family copper-binding protein [Candidatus Limnocylindrales bacterium]|nr:cupredoxin family copper-binding protein [Candidatus Limnocylindrales bacterium]